MAVAVQYTQIDERVASSGEILTPTLNVGAGTPTAMSATGLTMSTDLGSQTNFAGTISGTSAYCGFRVSLGGADMSSNDYVQFQATYLGGSNQLQRHRLDTWANGGMRLIFEDSSGNYAGYNMFGVDWSPFGGATDGFFSGFGGFGNSLSAQFEIEKARTPDYASGTIDWSDVDAYEVHFLPTGSGIFTLTIGRLQTMSPPIATGTVNFDDFSSTLVDPSGSDWDYERSFSKPPVFQRSTPETLFYAHTGIQIGDGSTTTTFSDSAKGVTFWVLPEDSEGGSSAYEGVGSFILIENPRLIDINQSASDSVSMTDCSFSSSSGWGIKVQGSTSGTCTFTRVTHTRYSEMDLQHSTSTNCDFVEGLTRVLITADTAITRSTVRDGVGIEITGAAGDYSGIGIEFEGNSVDITVGAGGAGTYDLTGISVVSGYTLKIHNISASNAVTVTVPSGITTSTTTAGGSITVQNPANTVDITVTAQETDGTAIENARVYLTAATTTADYTAGDVILNGLTDSSGQITTSETATVSQPVTGYVRKSSSSPFFKEGILSGTISSSSGYNQTAVLVLDE